MPGALRELLAIFDIQVDDRELKAGEKTLDGFVEKLSHIGKVIGEVFAAKELYEFIKGNIEVNAHLQDLSNRLDVGAQTIRSFGFVAKDAGVDLEAAANSLGLLQKNMGTAAEKGGETAAAFAKLGVATTNADGSTRDMREVLGDVAEGMQKLPGQNQRAAVAMQLFGRAGRQLVPVFSQGREAFEEMMAEADELGNGLGDDFYKRVKAAADGFEHFQHVVQSLKDRALDAILPAVTWLGNALTTVSKAILELDKHTHIIGAGMVTLALVVGGLLVDALLTAAAAAWTLLAPLIAEFGIPIAIIGGLVWIFQDLFSLMEGGESVIGKLLDRLFGAGAAAKFAMQLKEAWSATKDAINSAAFALGYFFGVWAGLGKVTLGSNAIGTFFANTIKLILAASRLLLGFVQAIEAIPEAINSGSFEPIGKAVDKAGDAVFGKEGILGELGAGQHSTNLADYGYVAAAAATRDPVSQHREAGRGDVVPKAPHVGGTTVNLPPARGAAAAAPAVTVQQTNQNTITVHTASDKPGEVGKATGDGVATATQKDLSNALISVAVP